MTITKKQLKELQRETKNREMFQMLDATHSKYRGNNRLKISARLKRSTSNRKSRGSSQTSSPIREMQVTSPQMFTYLGHGQMQNMTSVRMSGGPLRIKTASNPTSRINYGG